MRFIIGLILRIGIIELFIAFFVLINLFTFLLYKWRVNEKVLIVFTILGGIGALFICKRKFPLIIGLIIACIPIIHIVHSFTLDKIIRYIEMDFYSQNWHSELDGYRIAFMTDFHTITDKKMQEVVIELNKRNIDLLLLGGDFSMINDHYQGTIREIAKTITTDGIFGVEGNHDDYTKLFNIKTQYNIIMLDNSGLQIRNGFYVAGVQDKWNQNPNIQEAIIDASLSDFILLISHNPDIAISQSTNEIDLILAGHTHGGQITFFGIPFYLLRRSITNYGMRFGYGFDYSADGVPVFTSSGIGSYYHIPRIFARPEVVIFTMYNKL